MAVLRVKAFFSSQAYDAAGKQAVNLQVLLIALVCLRVTDLTIYLITLSWFGIAFNCVVLVIYVAGFYSAYTRNRPLTLCLCVILALFAALGALALVLLFLGITTHDGHRKDFDVFERLPEGLIIFQIFLDVVVIGLELGTAFVALRVQHLLIDAKPYSPITLEGPMVSENKTTEMLEYGTLGVSPSLSPTDNQIQ